MLEFRKVTIDDIPVLKRYFNTVTSRMCDYTAGAIVMWRDFYNTKYSIYEDTLVLMVHDSVFSIPCGANIDKMFSEIEAYCQMCNMPLEFCSVSEKDLEYLKTRYRLTVSTNRDLSDYLYLAEDLAELRGKKYSGPRNHTNRFKRDNQEYSYRYIDESNLADVQDFYKRLVEENEDKESESFIEDKEKTFEVLNNFSRYGQIGVALYVKDEVVAFGIGELVGDTLFEHIEKADTSYAGAYQMIASGFVSENMSLGMKYVNREDDEGDEGLRRSKLAYRPTELITKYTVKIV